MEPEPEKGDRRVSEEMEELAARAIRPERRLSIEDLLASELAAAALSEPLPKIRHTGEALMLLTEEERSGVGITDGEFEEARRIYALATALQNAHINKVIDRLTNTVTDRYAVIPWPFPREEAEKWLKWLGDDFKAGYFAPEDEERRKKIDEKLKAYSHFERIYSITANFEAMMETYKGIVIRFINYAMPKTTVLMRQIVGLVSAESYLLALRIMRGKKHGGGRV